MANWEDDEDEISTEEDLGFDPLPLPAAPTKLDPAKYTVTPTKRAPVTLEAPEFKKLPDSPPTDLTPEERVRWVVSQKYLQPQDDGESAVESAKSKSAWGKALTSVLEGMDGYQRAQAQALGFGGVNRGAYDSARKSWDDGVTEAKTDREENKKRAAAERAKDPASPESVRAKELWGSVYKEAYGGKLPEGYDALTAADFTAGAKAVKERIDGARKERDRQQEMVKQENSLNFGAAGDKYKGAVTQSVADANRADAADRASATMGQRSDQTNLYAGIKRGQQEMDKSKVDYTRQKDAAEIGVPGWKISDRAKIRPQEPEVKALRDSAAKVDNINYAVNQVKGLYKKEGNKLILPGEERAQAASYLAALTLKVGTRDAQGALQAPELDLVRQYIPDLSSKTAIQEAITKLSDEDASRFMTLLNTLQSRVNTDFSNEMTQRGYEPEQKTTETAAPRTITTQKDLADVQDGEKVIFNGAAYEKVGGKLRKVKDAK